MGLFKSLTRVVANTALLPVAAVKDIIALGDEKKKEINIVVRGEKLLSSLKDTVKDLEKMSE